jgi:hypothetical protein
MVSTYENVAAVIERDLPLHPPCCRQVVVALLVEPLKPGYYIDASRLLVCKL